MSDNQKRKAENRGSGTPNNNTPNLEQGSDAVQPTGVDFTRRARWLDLVPTHIRIQAGHRLISETPAIVAGGEGSDRAMTELAVALLAGCGLDVDECIGALADFMLSSGKLWNASAIGKVLCRAIELAPLADPCDMATHLEYRAAEVVQAIGVWVDVKGGALVLHKGDKSLRFLPAPSDPSKAVQYEHALLQLLPDVPSNLLKAAAKVMAINPEMERGIRAHRLMGAMPGPFRALRSLFS